MIVVIISHLVNVAVAGLVAILLIKRSPKLDSVYGPSTPARSILASVYFAIALTSAFALLFPVYSMSIALVLFPLQIFYKLSTIFTVGSITHPVVVSNVLISILHGLSLLMLFNYI